MSDAAPTPLAQSTTLSVWGHAAVLLLALVGLVANVVAGLGFPDRAPAEWVVNASFTLVLTGVVAACAVGFGFSVKRPAATPARVFPWLGVVLAALALIAWALGAGGLFQTLFAGGRGNYADDVVGALIASVPWALGAIFSAYGMRGASTPGRNAAAWVGIALWAVVLVGIVASAVLYAAGLTD